MGRPAKTDAPFILTCNNCNVIFNTKKHHRSKWRRGQRDFYCCSDCFHKSREGVPNPAFSEVLRGNKYRLNKPPGNKKYSVNKDFFKYVNNAEVAYWLGYIAADGHVAKNNRLFQITSIDEEQIYKLIDSLKSNHKVSIKEPREPSHKRIYTLGIYDRDFVKRLIEQGIINNKTYKLKYPYQINNENMKHYIRGYFDGDGSITTSRRSIQFNLVGTYALISGVTCFLKGKGIIKSDSFRKDGNIFRLQRSQNQAIQFLNYIYEKSLI